MSDYQELVDKMQKWHENCPNCQGKETLVIGRGNSDNPKIVFIGEAPGAEESKQGIPFCGRSGQLLDKWIKAAGLCPDDYYILNVTKCRPPENRTPALDEIKAHSYWLEEQLKILKPTVIVTLGRTALDSMYNFEDQMKNYPLSVRLLKTLSEDINQFFEHRDHKIILPFYHPSYALRNGGSVPELDKFIALLRQINEKYWGIVKVDSVGGKLEVFHRFNQHKIKVTVLNYEDYNYCYTLDEDGNHETIFGQKVQKIQKFKGMPKDSEKYFEADVSPYQRYLIENERRGTLPIAEQVRVGVIDIETKGSIDVVNAPQPIISAVLQDSITQKYKVYVLRHEKNDEIPHTEIEGLNLQFIEFENEKDLVSKLMIDIAKFDIITGWNVAAFDMLYISRRAVKLGLNDSLMSPMGYTRNTITKDEERFEGMHFRIFGLDIVDCVALARAYFATDIDRPESLTLRSFASHVFKDTEGKLDTDSPQKLWESHRYDELIKYNVRDVQIVVKACSPDSTNLMNLIFARRNVVRAANFDEAQFTSKLIDRLLFTRNPNSIFPSKKHVSEKVDFEGAIVFPPVPGVHSAVGVFDFSGMYPSIMRSYNISSETITSDPSKAYSRVGDTMFSDEEATTIGLVEYLIKNKDEIKASQKKASTEQKAAYYAQYEVFKGFTNSSYGVFAYQGFRLYDVRVASSITRFGRELITHLWDYVKTKPDFQPIYGDTDSVFIEIINPALKENFEIQEQTFQKLSDELNDEIEKFSKTFLVRDSDKTQKLFLNVGYDTLYQKVLFSSAKKGYIGFVQKFRGTVLSQRKLHGRGLIIFRRDCPKRIKSILRDDITNFLDGTSIESIMSTSKTTLRECSFDELLVYKQIGKELNQYKVLPQHVRAMQYSNQNLGTEFSKSNYIGGMIFVKYRNSGRKPHTDVIMLEKGMDMPNGFEVDYEKYFDLFIRSKLQLILPESYAAKIGGSMTLMDFM